MWAPLLLLSLTAMLHPGAAGAPRTDPCAAPPPRDETGCGQAPFCSARARVELACQLRTAMEERYAFFDVKGALLPPVGGAPFDSRRHLDGCVAAERSIAREDDPLRFYDRLRRCTAAFADGHLLFGAPAALPEVTLGVGLRRAGGKVVVASREEGLVERLAAAGTSGAGQALATGVEVLEIGGRPVADVVRDLSGYVSASSPGARVEHAVDALTRRDFAHPSGATATLTVSLGGERRTVTLPWSVEPGTERHPLTRGYVRRTGIPVAARRPMEGAARTDPILPGREAAALGVYLGRSGRPALRSGVVSRSGARSFCYLQILTFHTDTLSGPGGTLPFASVVEGLVRGCRSSGLDLVLDLRHNEGGYLTNATSLVAALLPSAGSAPAGALLLRASAQNREVFLARSSGPVDGLEPRRVLAAVAAARSGGRSFTPAFAEPPVTASPSVGGYDGRVVALVSSTCMSACDRAVAMLHGANRAILVGEPSEGAGGSQQESRGVGTRWKDPAGHLSVRIPNAAMGIVPAGRAPPAGSELGAEEFFASLSFENRPIEPHVPYATRLEDVTGENRGWLATVEALLSSREAPRVAGGVEASPPAQGAHVAPGARRRQARNGAASAGAPSPPGRRPAQAGAPGARVRPEAAGRPASARSTFTAPSPIRPGR